MSTSRNNKNKTSGLRFLWIPGRKKHHGHKGHFDTTNKTVRHPGGSSGKNEPWSMGGGKGLEKLVESDIPGSSEGTSRIISSLPTTYAIAAGATTTVMKLDETNQFAYLDDDVKDDKDATNDPGLMKTTGNNANSSNRDNPTNNSQENSKNKTSEKDDRGDKVEANGKKNNHNSKSKDDINSIESLQEKKLKDSAFDITDSSLYVSTYNGKKKKNKKKKKKNKGCPNDDEEEEEDPDKNIVKCLYFTLMCCECTIS